jgi:hypothetical protein
MMTNILRDLINEGHIIVYLNYILIYTDTLDEHHRIVRRILETLEKHKLFLKPEKCDFEKIEIEYLGVIISHNSMRIDPAKRKRDHRVARTKERQTSTGVLGFC